MPPEKMLPFAARVVRQSASLCSQPRAEFPILTARSWLQAAAGCRALGARTGLPVRTDPRLAPFLV